RCQGRDARAGLARSLKPTQALPIRRQRRGLRQGPLASAPAGPQRLVPLSGCTGARANTRSCIIVRSGSLRLAGRLALPEGLQVDLLPRREGTSRNGWQPTADALLTMELLRQPLATGRNGFGSV